MTTETVEKPSQTDEEAVRKAFPQKGRLDRRVGYLFGKSFFRVNYHDPDQENKIVETHFVEVFEGKAIDRTTRAS